MSESKVKITNICNTDDEDTPVSDVEGTVIPIVRSNRPALRIPPSSPPQGVEEGDKFMKSPAEEPESYKFAALTKRYSFAPPATPPRPPPQPQPPRTPKKLLGRSTPGGLVTPPSSPRATKRAYSRSSSDETPTKRAKHSYAGKFGRALELRGRPKMPIVRRVPEHKGAPKRTDVVERRGAPKCAGVIEHTRATKRTGVIEHKAIPERNHSIHRSSVTDHKGAAERRVVPEGRGVSEHRVVTECRAVPEHRVIPPQRSVPEQRVALGRKVVPDRRPVSDQRVATGDNSVVQRKGVAERTDASRRRDTPKYDSPLKQQYNAPGNDGSREAQHNAPRGSSTPEQQRGPVERKAAPQPKGILKNQSALATPKKRVVFVYGYVGSMKFFRKDEIIGMKS
ncbi:hypothetical protein Cantr_03982 [Candida viswanathii]|uniref:Uncharacterized protein n=1 Tax=Candida viswanathii TaxID=5486 RepID=A0A367XL78_9ASCO|nr:hypothetical protein Cantr_03982 [Candida viswanathii]